jgi:1-acyl-sn-glycerol-3-phosphate acyltransferase
MIKANKNNIINLFFGIYHNRLLRKHFYQIHLGGGENFNIIDPSLPVILYANHSNWWDGFIAYYMTNKLWKQDDYLMMDIEQMKTYSFFKYIGVFSVDRKNSKSAIKSIEYAANLLKGTNKYMWIFPQGTMQPQDYRPIEFYNGITKLTEKLGGVNLLHVSIRYEFLMEQRPEVFIKLGKPDVIKGIPAKELTLILQNKLVQQLDELREDVVKGKLTGYQTVFRGKSSRNKTVDKIRKHS